MWAHQLILDALRHLGGDELARTALAEASRYADQHFPWDGHGPEPQIRLIARLNILTDRLHDNASGA